MASRRSPPAEPRFFPSAAQFRAWLARHAATAPELIVGYWKVGSGRPSMGWSESVDEALCFGWIDGVRTRLDDHSYKIRFTPRRPGSIWSAINIAKVEALSAAGRMQPAGLAAYAQRLAHKSKVYAYEQAETTALTAEEAAAFQADPAAASFFERVAPSYRKTVLHWLGGARQPATRARRFARLLQACAEQRKLV
jgi:uncharacterized protein YdeI (YjbR/CyaY-like superfamily)